MDRKTAKDVAREIVRDSKWQAWYHRSDAWAWHDRPDAMLRASVRWYWGDVDEDAMFELTHALRMEIDAMHEAC